MIRAAWYVSQVSDFIFRPISSQSSWVTPANCQIVTLITRTLYLSVNLQSSKITTTLMSAPSKYSPVSRSMHCYFVYNQGSSLTSQDSTEKLPSQWGLFWPQQWKLWTIPTIHPHSLNYFSPWYFFSFIAL